MIPSTANKYIRIRVTFLKENEVGLLLKTFCFLVVSEPWAPEQGAEHPLLGRQGCQGLVVSAGFPLKKARLELTLI